MRVTLFSKGSKFDLGFKNTEKNLEKSFCFLDNCIWVGCVNLSLLRRVYFSSAVSVSTNSSEILHITKRDSFLLNFFTLINKYDKGALVQVSKVFGNV